MDSTNPKEPESIQEMSRVAENFLDLAFWGFEKSFQSEKTGVLIYDSRQCRLNLVWGGWDYLSGHTISIYYGRLHTPNEKSTMIWKEEECYCWHRFEHALHFLDGCTPAEAVKLDYSHFLINPFYESKFREGFKHRQPEWLAKMHSVVWEQYGERLFDLFDLQRPDLWEQYCQFLRGFYDIKGRLPFIKPAMDSIC